MPRIHLEDLTPFGRAALKLDREFAELALLGERMAKADLESDDGLEHAVRTLEQCARRGESLAASMQEFAVALQEARDQADGAVKLVGERAQLVKSRRQEQDTLEEKLAELRDAVKAAGAEFAARGKPQSGPPSDAEKRRIAAELERVRAPMQGFVAAAKLLKAEAAKARFRRVERQADAMIDSLNASLKKIGQALGEK